MDKKRSAEELADELMKAYGIAAGEAREEHYKELLGGEFPPSFEEYKNKRDDEK